MLLFNYNIACGEGEFMLPFKLTKRHRHAGVLQRENEWSKLDMWHLIVVKLKFDTQRSGSRLFYIDPPETDTGFWSLIRDLSYLYARSYDSYGQLIYFL